VSENGNRKKTNRSSQRGELHPPSKFAQEPDDDLPYRKEAESWSDWDDEYPTAPMRISELPDSVHEARC